MQVRWLECRLSSIGMTAPTVLVGITDAAVEFRFHLGRLKPAEFAKLMATVRQGYTMESLGLIPTLLNLLAHAHQLDEANIPPVPRMSYLGKKALRIYTLAGRERAIADELIATAQMLDAKFPKSAVTIRTQAVSVAAWDIHVNTIGMSRREKTAAHLKSQFVGIAPMMRQWCSETVAEREALINYLITVPTIPMRLVHKKEKSNAS
jgi:hypothetical protein